MNEKNARLRWGSQWAHKVSHVGPIILQGGRVVKLADTLSRSRGLAMTAAEIAQLVGSGDVQHITDTLWTAMMLDPFVSRDGRDYVLLCDRHGCFWLSDDAREIGVCAGLLMRNAEDLRKVAWRLNRLAAELRGE